MVMRRAPCRDAAGIERRGAADEVVRRIAVQQRAHAGIAALQIWIADDDQALFTVGDIEEAVHQMNRLLFVLRLMRAQRVDAQRGRRGHGRGVARLDVELLAERRNRRGRDMLGEIFVVDVGDVVDAEAARRPAPRRDIRREAADRARCRRGARAVVSSRLRARCFL